MNSHVIGIHQSRDGKGAGADYQFGMPPDLVPSTGSLTVAALIVIANDLAGLMIE